MTSSASSIETLNALIFLRISLILLFMHGLLETDAYREQIKNRIASYRFRKRRTR
jgi:hypothetical protein